MSEETRTLLEVLSLLDRMYCQAVEEDPDFPTKIGVEEVVTVRGGARA
ncbi:MAG: hypothetical protein PHF64_00175 [Methanoregula sp.]|jgi:hypothetical protein|nr:hypothetical protein [Methanoregula sp.]